MTDSSEHIIWSQSSVEPLWKQTAVMLQSVDEQFQPKSSNWLVAPPSGCMVSLSCVNHRLYLEYDGNRGILRQCVVSQVESALFDNHISSAFLLVSGAAIEEKDQKKYDKNIHLTKKMN